MTAEACPIPSLQDIMFISFHCTVTYTLGHADGAIYKLTADIKEATRVAEWLAQHDIKNLQWGEDIVFPPTIGQRIEWPDNRPPECGIACLRFAIQRSLRETFSLFHAYYFWVIFRERK